MKLSSIWDYLQQGTVDAKEPRSDYIKSSTSQGEQCQGKIWLNQHWQLHNIPQQFHTMKKSQLEIAPLVTAWDVSDWDRLAQRLETDSSGTILGGGDSNTSVMSQAGSRSPWDRCSKSSRRRNSWQPGTSTSGTPPAQATAGSMQLAYMKRQLKSCQKQQLAAGKPRDLRPT